MEKELEYTTTAFWWNFGRRKLDYSGNLGGLLNNKGIKYRKIKHPEQKITGYKFTTVHGVTYTCYGSFYDGAFTALKLYYATMGDKATVNCAGRIFTINH